jgi:AcrR family transcriptional regulator
VCDNLVMASLRARVRAEITAEIKQTARRHLAAEGASNLSLRAVAREMGMVSSALYRYFSSRDELLTALIIDAYDSMGSDAEIAESAVPRADLAARHSAICHAVREWALARPHEYALIYGSPVPGYDAPQDTVPPASRVVRLLIQIVVDGVDAGVIRPQPADWLNPGAATDLARLAAEIEAPVAPTILARGMIAWIELFGAVSFEVFGRLNDLLTDRRAWFDHQVLAMARLVGLRP